MAEPEAALLQLQRVQEACTGRAVEEAVKTVDQGIILLWVVHHERQEGRVRSLQALDDRTASDHLPVLMVFNNPFDAPFRLTSFTSSNTAVRMTWETAPQRRYRVEASSNSVGWESLTTNITASGTNLSWTGVIPAPLQFFRVYRVP